MIPTVDVDPVTKKTEWTSVEYDIHLHERHRQSGASRDGVRENLLTPSNMSLQRASVSPSPESKNFVIAGIIDIKTGHKLSLAQAIAKGIIDLKNGLYINPETGEAIPLAEAIARGLVTVEAADGLVNGDAASALSVAMETVTNAVTAVLDPSTGELATTTAAVKAGTLDIKKS